MLDCDVDHYTKMLIYSSSTMQLNNLPLLGCFQPCQVGDNFILFIYLRD